MPEQVHSGLLLFLQDPEPLSFLLSFLLFSAEHFQMKWFLLDLFGLLVLQNVHSIDFVGQEGILFPAHSLHSLGVGQYAHVVDTDVVLLHQVFQCFPLLLLQIKVVHLRLVWILSLELVQLLGLNVGV